MQQHQATVRGFSVSTRCESVEEFIATFRDRCDEQSIVINVSEPRAVGTECAFAILLANKKPVLAGTCVVLDVFNDTNNAFKRRGMRLGIKRLGVESERVFAELAAARLANKRKATELGFRPSAAARPTMALPIVTTDVAVVDVVTIPAASPAAASETSDGAAVVMSRRMTQPMRGLRVEAPRARPRLSSVHIPPIEKPVDGATATASRIIGRERHLQKKQTNSPVAILAEGSGDTRQPSEAVTTRTPGSSYILPANPLTNVTDASLEGLVDCRLFESHVTDDRDSADQVATVDRVVDDGPTEPVEMPLLIAAELELARAKRVNHVPVPIAAVEPRDAASPRRQLLLAAALAPALAAVVAMVATSASPSPSAVVTDAPAIALGAETMTVRSSARVEAPPASTQAPTVRQPIHSVLVKTYPIAATVTVGDRSFGTTPTYIKIPANTPVEVRIARAGFKPVTRLVTSKQRLHEVFVPLQPNRAAKPTRVRKGSARNKQAPMDLSDL